MHSSCQLLRGWSIAPWARRTTVPQRLRALASRRPCPRRVTPLPPRGDSRTAVTTPTGTARTKPTTARTDRWSGSALPRQPIVRQLVSRFHPRNPSGLGKPESPPGVRVAQGAQDTRPRMRHLRSTVTLWIFIEQRRVDNEALFAVAARFRTDGGSWQRFLPTPGGVNSSGSVLFQGVFRGVARNPRCSYSTRTSSTRPGRAGTASGRCDNRDRSRDPGIRGKRSRNQRGRRPDCSPGVRSTGIYRSAAVRGVEKGRARRGSSRGEAQAGPERSPARTAQAWTSSESE